MRLARPRPPCAGSANIYEWMHAPPGAGQAQAQKSSLASKLAERAAERANAAAQLQQSKSAPALAKFAKGMFAHAITAEDGAESARSNGGGTFGLTAVKTSFGRSAEAEAGLVPKKVTASLGLAGALGGKGFLGAVSRAVEAKAKQARAVDGIVVAAWAVAASRRFARVRCGLQGLLRASSHSVQGECRVAARVGWAPPH